MRSSMIVTILVSWIAFAAGARGTPNYSVVFLDSGGFEQTQATGIAGGQVVGYSIDNTLGSHALLWTIGSGGVIDLGFQRALGTDGVHQVGERGGHASLWAGTAQSLVDLHPNGYTSSEALGVAPGEEVGFGARQSDGSFRALRWGADAQGAMDLTPLGAISAIAFGTNGTQQVGRVSFPTTPGNQSNDAILWSGTAESGIVLTPMGYAGSEGRGLSGDHQVGTAGLGGFSHALLWSGNASEYVDLNPTLPFISDTEGLAIAGDYQAGDGEYKGISSHAIVWRGSAGSAIDLHAFLPSQYISSVATGVDQYGNVVGWATTAPDHAQAVMWVVPEPSGLSCLAIVGARLLFGRRKKR